MEFYFEVAPTKIVRSNSEVFTYASKEKLKIGKKNMTGIVWREVQKPDFETREIIKIIEKIAIPEHLIQLSK